MRPLRVGTDYSGIEAIAVALRELRQPMKHLFSSEICPHARKVIRMCFNPATLFEDALQPRTLPSKLDLYIAGFPCPVFSKLNSLTGKHRFVKNPLKHFKNLGETGRVTCDSLMLEFNFQKKFTIRFYIFCLFLHSRPQKGMGSKKSMELCAGVLYNKWPKIKKSILFGNGKVIGF